MSAEGIMGLYKFALEMRRYPPCILPSATPASPRLRENLLNEDRDDGSGLAAGAVVGRTLPLYQVFDGLAADPAIALVTIDL